MSSSVAGLDNLFPTSTFSFSNFIVSSCPFTDFFASYNTTCEGTNTSRSNNNEKGSPGSWGLSDNLTGSNDNGEGGGDSVGVPKFKSLYPTEPPFSPTSPSFLAATTNTNNSASTSGAAPFSPSMFLDSPLLFPNSNNFPFPTVGALHGEGFSWTSCNNNNQRSMGEGGSSKNNQNYCNFSFQSQSVPTIINIPTARQQKSSWNLQESTRSQQNEIKSNTTTTNTNTNTNPAAAFQSNNQRGSYLPQFMRATKQLDDGYNWRKYGQKQVKRSENPRSYYKCSYTNCQTKKKVERSLINGHITEIIYKGSHNHPKPLPRKSPSNCHQIGSSSDTNVIMPPSSLCSSILHNKSSQMEYSTVNIRPETSSVLLKDDDFDHNSSAMSITRTIDNHMELDSKRWKGENETEMMSVYGTRAVRETRFIVQTTSEIDLLDDGYRWRKYGKKVVRGNPNPRSYYKCTSNGCPVKKHIERESQDQRAIITTYQGKHNHDVPAARGSNSSCNNINRLPTQNNISNSIVPAPGRSSAISYHQSNATTSNSLPSGQPQVYTLQMLRSGTTTEGANYGFSSGFGNNPSRSFMNQM